MKNVLIRRISEERIIPTKKYDIPFVIILTGDVGSGKSLVSMLLSKELNLYLISGDYIRNIISDVVPNIDLTNPDARTLVNDIMVEEVNYCFKNNFAIILDRSVSSKKTLKSITGIVGNRPIVLIKLHSNDEQNIERVKSREEKRSIMFEHYGHPNNDSYVTTEEEYYVIKNRKVYDLDDKIYDYHLDMSMSIADIKKQIDIISDDIRKTKIR